MATADKLRKLLETKNKLKQALINKGVDVADTDSFDSYVDKITSINNSSSNDLPKGYIRCNHIYNGSANALGIVDYLTQDYDVEIYFQWVSKGATGGCGIFGGGASNPTFRIFRANSYDQITVGYCNSTFRAENFPCVANQTYKVKFGKSGIWINDEYQGEFATNVNMNVSYTLLGTQGYSQHDRVRVKYVKVWKDDELIRHFMPVKIYNSQTNVGFYDVVYGRFSTFTTGMTANIARVLTINPTPSNAKVTITSTQAGIFPQYGNSIDLWSGVTAEYIIEADGYKKHTGSITIGDEDVTLDITLEESDEEWGGEWDY